MANTETEYYFTYGDLSGNFFVRPGNDGCHNIYNTLRDLLIDNGEIDKFLDTQLLTELKKIPKECVHTQLHKAQDFIILK